MVKILFPEFEGSVGPIRVEHGRKQRKGRGEACNLEFRSVCNSRKSRQAKLYDLCTKRSTSGSAGTQSSSVKNKKNSPKRGETKKARKMSGNGYVAASMAAG